MVKLEFNAIVRGRNNSDKLRELTISAVEMKKKNLQLELGDAVKVIIERLE